MAFLFDPKLKEPFKLSRSKIDLFMKCPHCFYLDRKLGIGIPSGPGFSLNSAVDALLKKEFDIYRAKNQKHPLMEKYGINAVPLAHVEMENWRNNFRGIQYLHKPTNLLIFGAIDDIWQMSDGSIAIVDYKSTSTSKEITLDDEWKESYKRQMEIYQWLFEKNGFKIAPQGYFVYCNGLKDRDALDGKLDFDLSIISYTGDNSWVEKAIFDIFKTLKSLVAPSASPTCEYCDYVSKAKKLK